MPESIHLYLLDSNRLTSTFPDPFVSEYATRLVGPRHEDTDTAIAEFINADLLGKSESTKSKNCSNIIKSARAKVNRIVRRISLAR